MIGITLVKPSTAQEALTGKTYDTFWLGVVISVVKSILSALLGVTSRRAKEIHFTVLMSYNGLIGFTLPLVGMGLYYWS